MLRPSLKEKISWHLIKDIYPLDNFILRSYFYDGKVTEFDISKFFDTKPFWNGKPAFNIIKEQPKNFKKAKIDGKGFAVIWNDYCDIDCESLYHDGKDIKNPFGGFLSFSDACFLWNLNESTLRKAVSYKKLQPGIDCAKFGNQWLVTIEAMTREYGTAPELINI